MNITLLVEVRTDDTDLLALASDVQDALLAEFDVISVKPWKRQNLPASPVPTFGQPSATPPDAPANT